MKKLLLSFFVTVIAVASANAQACTPDPQYTTPGIYPDSATGLNSACVDQAYMELITNVVPADTLVDLPIIGPTPIPIDSVWITDWQGLPTGFTYACYDAGNTISPLDNCCYEGGTTGCAVITGTPTMNELGSHQQIITVEASAGNGLQTSTTIVDYYYIHVLDCTNSVPTILGSKFLVYPNPAKEKITLNGLNDIDVESVVITNMNGQQMAYYDNIDAPALDMDLNHLDNGMYFVTINYNGVTEMIKFIKE